MEILEDSTLARYLFERYSSNPKNWNFIISTSSHRDGFFDATVSSTDEVWQLKIDSIYKPVPMVLGTKLDMDSTKIERRLDNAVAPFGYRKLDPSMIMSLLKGLSEEQHLNATAKEADLNNQFNSILGSLDTVKPETGTSYAYGPFVYTEKNLASHDENQKQVADKLASKLRNDLRKRYSSYG
ncbi:MAG: hypothetical protein QN732_11595 [Nitrososphaeraceae archaeon]|nr:hypothetical protein [Nitrososphaeraceae archaeon]